MSEDADARAQVRALLVRLLELAEGPRRPRHKPLRFYERRTAHRTFMVRRTPGRDLCR